MMKKKLPLVLFAVGITFSLVGLALPIEIDQTTAKTSFVAIGKPAMLRIHGESEGITSKLDADKKTVSGSIAIQLEKFKTGIETRDEHMKNKYLEVAKYPEAILTIKDVNVSDLKEGSKKDLTIKAKLLLHGETKDVDVKGTIESLAGGKYKVHATANITLSEFKIDIPTYAGIKVADSVEFEVNFQTK